VHCPRSPSLIANLVHLPCCGGGICCCWVGTCAGALPIIAQSLCALMRHEDEGARAALGAQDCLDGLLRAAAREPRPAGGAEAGARG
jgi:hypothetical protein